MLAIHYIHKCNDGKISLLSCNEERSLLDAQYTHKKK